MEDDRLRNDNAKLRDRSAKGEPRARLITRIVARLDKSLESGTVSHRLATFPLSWKHGHLKKERPTTLSRILVVRGIRTAALWKFGTVAMEVAEGYYVN